MPVSSRRHTVAAILAVALVVGLSGCGDDEVDLPEQGPDLAPPATSEPSPPATTLSPEESEAVDEVVAAYDAFMEAYVDLARAGEAPTGDAEGRLAQYAEPAVAGVARNLVLQDYLDGRASSGELTWTVQEVAEVDLEHTVDDTTVPQVVVRFCVDGTGWEPVDLETGEPVAEPPGRYVSTVTAQWRDEREFGPQGWALHERDDDGSQSC